LAIAGCAGSGSGRCRKAIKFAFDFDPSRAHRWHRKTFTSVWTWFSRGQMTSAKSTMLYLTEFKEDYVAFNAAYASYFPADRRPARTCIGVTGLARDACVEIDMIARRPSL
jgi:hypothetical protein